MARLLLVTHGPAGMRYSMVELGRRLAAAGHEVRLAGDTVLEPLARHHGLAFIQLAPSGLPAFRSKDRERGMINRWRHLGTRRDAAVEATRVRDYETVLGKEAPDLVLMDGELQEHILASRGAGVPLVLLNTFASIWRQPGSPPPHLPTLPGVGFAGSPAGITLGWTRFQFGKRWRSAARWFRNAGCDRESILRRMAKALDVPLARETSTRDWLVPFTWPGLPALSLHASEFEFDSRFPRRVRFVGPLVLRDRNEAPMPEKDRLRLDALLSGPVNPEERLLFAGFGSYFTSHPGWLKRLIEALERRPDWRLILSLGGQSEAKLPSELPPNVHAFPWLPQLEVLERADAAIVHGGINSIDECVLAGVPMLVCNGGVTDMPGNQARIVHHGLGIAADPDRDSAADITSRLDRLLSDDGIREKMATFTAAYEGYETTGAAVSAVEALLNESAA